MLHIACILYLYDFMCIEIWFRGRNARGLLDRNYWRGSLNPRPTVDWYLHKTAQAIEKVQELNPDGPITLLAHSAGGWLGRLYLLEFGTTGIDRFVSLGSPHLPPPQGVIDQTRGILTWITERSPGAYHADDLEYVTIAGKFIKGSPLLGPGDFYSRVIGLGYNQVCGESAVWGDGVVPIPSAHLEGAMQLTLDGIYHSPLGASLDVEENVILTAAESSYVDSDDYDDLPGQEVSADEPATTPAARKWYGSKSVVPQWVHLLRVSAAPSNKNVLKRDV